MKTYWGMEVQRHAFLTSALDRGKWSASRLSGFTSGKGAHSTNRIGGWVGPTADLDSVPKRKIPSFNLLKIEPRSSSP